MRPIEIFLKFSCQTPERQAFQPLIQRTGSLTFFYINPFPPPDKSGCL